MEKGFYKNDNGTLLFAPNFVESNDFQLYKENKDNYTYPIQGWYWFDTQQESETTLGIEYSIDNFNIPPFI